MADVGNFIVPAGCRRRGSYLLVVVGRPAGSSFYYQQGFHAGSFHQQGFHQQGFRLLLAYANATHAYAVHAAAWKPCW